jgi:glycosyltransferase involved in cell wall biosynthesis
MINLPQISVLMPVYNCESYIAEAVESILNQTFSDFELLIIDDCSTDNTVSIIKSYNDSRINLIVKPINSGYTNSLNYGLTIAKGEFIARMDGDDISLPTRFEEQIKVLSNNLKVIVCGTNASIIGSEQDIIKPEKHETIFANMIVSNPIIHPSVIIRKSVLDNLEYDKLKEPAEDFDLWTKLIWKGDFYNIQKKLLLYRVHENNITKIKNKTQKDNVYNSRSKFICKINSDISHFDTEVFKKYFFEIENISKKDFILINTVFKNIKRTNKFSKIQTQELIKIVNSANDELLSNFCKNNKLNISITILNQLSMIQCIKWVKYSLFN